MQMISPAQFAASQPELLKKVDALPVDIKAALKWNWHNWWARPNQVAPEGDWATWLILAGRGFGKTEAGAQWVRSRVANGARSIALVAETQKDLEEVMVPRILAITPEHERPTARFKPVRLIWPNGAQALGYNGTEPDQLRGPEFDTAWVDELAKYRYASDVWDMLQMTMRRDDPRVCVTTTPRPIPIIRKLAEDNSTAVTRGSTFDNSANLSPRFLGKLREDYEGTRLGRQELYAELLDEAEGALWNRDMIEAAREAQAPQLVRVVVAIDPAVTNTPGSDETGIIVAGVDTQKQGWVLADGSGRMSPGDWAKRAIELFNAYGADRIVAEGNQGGDMVRHTLRTEWPQAPVKVVHASRGKVARAEPVAALYEQGRVKHAGDLAKLEDQMVTWEPHSGMPSPDRVDALVWAMTELIVKRPGMATEPIAQKDTLRKPRDYSWQDRALDVEDWKVV